MKSNQNLYNHKPLKELAGAKIEWMIIHLKKFVEKMINLYYFTDRILNRAFNFNRNCQLNIQINYKVTIPLIFFRHL